MSPVPVPPAALPTGRVGYVALVGRPNTGKSTFLNTVLDYHLVAVADQPQTTRRNWRGILSTADSQIVFVDTPGCHVGRTKLGAAMLKAVGRSLEDADVVFCLADPTRAPGDEDALVAERVASAGKPVFLLLNKCDVADAAARAAMRDRYLATLGPAPRVFETCARDRATLEPVLAAARAALPEGSFFYDPEQLTDSFVRDLGAELIREALLAHLHEEVPHASAVVVDRWQDGADRVTVDATVFVERESQKGIVVGHGGQMIKTIRRDAEPRLDLGADVGLNRQRLQRLRRQVALLVRVLEQLVHVHNVGSHDVLLSLRFLRLRLRSLGLNGPLPGPASPPSA
jgi:GTP-binding protein Era